MPMLSAPAIVIERSKAARLLGRREPIDGESLMSVLARACEASGFRSLNAVLKSIGIVSVPDFIPFTQVDRAGDLARLLGVAEHQVIGRMHPGSREVIDWWGEPMRRLFVEASARRYSPSSLRLSPHHRASWMMRAIPFCPESFELLRSDCPDCGRSLGWRYTRGVDHCEHCEASLVEGSAETVATDLRSAAARLAGLVSTDPLERNKVVRSLPPPFDNWRSSEVFEAVVELGVALHRFDTGDDHRGTLVLGRGRYEDLALPVLLRGLEMLDEWPGSLSSMLNRIGVVANAAGSTALADCLGPLSKFTKRDRARFPLAEALSAELASALRAARVVVKCTALSRFAPPEDDGLISEKEVLQQFDIHQDQLRRLDMASETLVLRRASVSKLYDRARLSDAVTAYRAAKTSTEVARIVGVPEYMVGDLAAAGLIDIQPSADATLLAGGELFTSASLDGLVHRAEALRGKSHAHLNPLAKVLQHIISPAAWIDALESVLVGNGARLDTDGSDLVGRVWVKPEAIYSALLRKAYSFPGDVCVSSQVAGKMIGQSDVIMCKAVTEGAIAGIAGDRRGHKIRLTDLYSFDRNYTFSSDLASRLGCSTYSAAKQLRAAGVHPARLVHRVALWKRTAAENALGLHPPAQHTILQRAV